MIQLNYKEYGLGEPVVILHGLFGTLDNWQGIAKTLSTQYTVFTLDMRNHGRSPHTPAPFNYDIMAEDVATFLQNNWIYEARVIGHSMGGKAAMQLAFSYPDLVKKLVVIDIAPKTYQGGHESVLAALNSIDLTQLADRKEAEAQLMAQLQNDTSTVQFLLKNLSRRPATEGGGFEWKMNLPVLMSEYPTIMGDVTGDTFDKPTLFVRGGDSDYILDKDWTAIQTRFPQAQLETIEGAGHWVHADQPQALVKTLADFLAL